MNKIKSKFLFSLLLCVSLGATGISYANSDEKTTACGLNIAASSDDDNVNIASDGNVYQI